MKIYKKRYQIYYSSIKTSSILAHKTFAISNASFSDGLYFHISKNTIVSLLTQTLLASSCCVKLCFALNSFILFFMAIIYN